MHVLRGRVQIRGTHWADAEGSKPGATVTAHPGWGQIHSWGPDHTFPRRVAFSLEQDF